MKIVSKVQSPFVTLFMYLRDDDEYIEENAMIIEEILRQRKDGIKNSKGVHVTPTFPKLVYVLDENNNLTGGKYDYLTRLAVECSAKRMYPDYISAKKMRENYEGNVFSPMGCVEGSSVIDYTINNVRYVESFERAWHRLIQNGYTVSKQPNGFDEYIDTPNVKIWDSKENQYVVQHRMIRNHQNKWYDITFTGGRHLIATNDHPFETENRGVVFAEDLCEDDIIIRDVNKPLSEHSGMLNKEMWLAGLVLCDGCYDEQVSISLGLDERDIATTAVESIKIAGFEPYIKEWYRGKKGNYLEIRVRKSSALCKFFKKIFEGKKKIDRHIPSSIFNASIEDKYSFMAGMIDADGYVNSSGGALRIQLGSTNKELAMQQMLLANDLGLNAVVYKNYYNSNKNSIQYRVEFDCDENICEYIISHKKKAHFNKDHRFNKNVISYSDTCSPLSIKYFEKPQYSYDVTTESEHFTVNGIYSHNCRSFLSPWKDENGNYKFEGRLTNVG